MTRFRNGQSPGFGRTVWLFPAAFAVHVTRLARREGLVTRRGELAAAAIGGTIHAAAVAQQVFFFETPRRREG